MKIEIKKDISKTEIIDVEFPCFFKLHYDFMGEISTIYIMLTEKMKYIVEKTILDECDIFWTCSKCERLPCSDYLFTDQNAKSVKQEFLSAKLEALHFFKNFIND